MLVLNPNPYPRYYAQGISEVGEIPDAIKKPVLISFGMGALSGLAVGIILSALFSRSQ